MMIARLQLNFGVRQHTGFHVDVVSVDLAYRDCRDIGVCLLQASGSTVDCEFVNISGDTPPTPTVIADEIHRIATERRGRLILVDGPQGWKDPESSLEHSRVCERQLNTPAKTGLPGGVKPGNYRGFVEFSIDVFRELTVRGWHLFSGSDATINQVVAESFPLAAWRALRIPPLPSKRKATLADIEQRFDSLRNLYRVAVDRVPNHDELQALVSGLAGIALTRGDKSGFSVAGCQPFELDGLWREGFIVGPARSAANSMRVV